MTTALWRESVSGAGGLTEPSPAPPSCLQGLTDESLLLLTQPSGVIHHLLVGSFSSSCLQMSILNNTCKKLIAFCFTWPEDLCDLGGSWGRKAERRI